MTTQNHNANQTDTFSECNGFFTITFTFSALYALIFEVSVVVCKLIRLKATIKTAGQTSKRKYE